MAKTYIYYYFTDVTTIIIISSMKQGYPDETPGILDYHISSNRSPRLLLEHPVHRWTWHYLKHQDSWFCILLLQSEIPGRPYRRSANHATRMNDTMHHSAMGDVQLTQGY